MGIIEKEIVTQLRLITKELNDIKQELSILNEINKKYIDLVEEYHK